MCKADFKSCIMVCALSGMDTMAAGKLNYCGATRAATNRKKKWFLRAFLPAYLRGLVWSSVVRIGVFIPYGLREMSQNHACGSSSQKSLTWSSEKETLRQMD